MNSIGTWEISKLTSSILYNTAITRIHGGTNQLRLFSAVEIYCEESRRGRFIGLYVPRGIEEFKEHIFERETEEIRRDRTEHNAQQAGVKFISFAFKCTPKSTLLTLLLRPLRNERRH